MLTPQLAPLPRVEGKGVGIALAGGGPLGAFFALGTLQALSEGIEGLDLTRLQAYVGVSSGSMLAAGLANGLTPVDIGRIVISNESGEFPASPGLFLHPAYREFARRVGTLPLLTLMALRYYVRAPLTRNLAEVLDPLLAALPTGLFDGDPLERFLRQLFTTHGRTNDFRELRRQLYIVATDLNTGEATRFGEPGQDHVPISSAIQASTALPGLYSPVSIDGRKFVDGALLRTMHASLALDAGAELVICINPLVAFDASAGGTRKATRDLTDSGLTAVLGQTFRSLIQSRMQVGMAAYRDRYPHADILLFEPDRDDERMFFANVFRYSDRRRVVDHAYQRGRLDLRRNSALLQPVLERHGLSLRRAALRDPRRSFHRAIDEQVRANAAVGRNLMRALSRLETLVARRAGIPPGRSPRPMTASTTRDAARSKLARLVDRYRVARQQVADDPELARQVRGLARYQANRLAETYADLRRDPRYTAAVEFFLSELYGPQDLGPRDAQILAALDKLQRFLPAAALDALAAAFELHVLTLELDAATAQHVPVGTALTLPVYAQAYRSAGRLADRERQIRLIAEIGRLLDSVAHHPEVGLAVRIARLPAHAAGYGQLQEFVEQGYQAYRTMDGAEDFIAAIDERERALMDQLLNSDTSRKDAAG